MEGNKWKIKANGFFEFLDFKKVKTVSVFTTAFMLAAYMYIYTNDIFLYDNAFIYRGTEKFSVFSDKWASALMGVFDAHINEPWLAGIWAVLFMIVSVYFIIDILEIESTWGICLVAGLCSTQSSIVCQQQYSGGQHTGEFALALACLAAWIFLKAHIRAIWKASLTAMCIALSAGIYGAYISMVPSLMILSIIMDIIYKGKNAKETWRKAILSVGQFIMGMILYYMILRIGLYFSGNQLPSYMGQESLSSVEGVIDKKNYIVEAYLYIIRYYLGRLSAYYQLHYLPGSLEKMALVGLIVGICISVMVFFRYRKKIVDFKYNIILLLGLLFILPLSLNLIYVMSSGNVHHLMIFTYVLPYVFFSKLTEMAVCDKERYIVGYLFGNLYKFIICIFIYYSVVMANATIVHLNNVYVRAQSIGTRVLERIESCKGFDGTETVHLVGDMRYNDYFAIPVEEAEILNAYLGPAMPNMSYGFDVVFLKNILDSRLNYDYDRFRSVEKFLEELTEAGVDEDIIKQIEKMPAFPYDGSVQKIEGDIYVIFTTDEMIDNYDEKYGL